MDDGGGVVVPVERLERGEPVVDEVRDDVVTHDPSALCGQGVRHHRNATGRPDRGDHVPWVGRLEREVVGPGVVQDADERRVPVREHACRDERVRHVRPPDRLCVTRERDDGLPRDREVAGQALDHRPAPPHPHGAGVLQQLRQRPVGRIVEVGQDVDGDAPCAGGDLGPPDEHHARRFHGRRGLLPPRDRVVVGERHHVDRGRGRAFEHLGR